MGRLYNIFYPNKRIRLVPDLDQEPSMVLLNQREWIIYNDQKIEQQLWEINNLPPNRFILYKVLN